jgi:selenocysteine-specific elongation factor
MPIKLHIGTTEVMGRIVFFDRNELKEENGEILCQLRLEDEIVTKRGDRFIIRRPSPQETIGGGWVIDPIGNKYRFGGKTIEELEKKKVGTPTERIIAALYEAKSLSLNELIKRTSLDDETVKDNLKQEGFIFYNGKEYTLQLLVDGIEDEMIGRLELYHDDYPMKQGLNKAELFQVMTSRYPKELLDYTVEKSIENGKLSRKGQFVYLAEFKPHVSKSWQKRVENLLVELKSDGLKTQYFTDYLKKAGIPDQLVPDLKRFLEEQHLIVPLDDQYYYHGEVFTKAVDLLRKGTGSEFEVGNAKEILDLSRKYMIPFLERLDSKGLTKRVENKRVWT